MKSEVFKTGIMMLSLAFGKKLAEEKFSETQLKMYFGCLSKLEDEIFLTSIQKILDTQENFYQTTNIVALIKNTAKSLIKGPTSSELWEEIVDASMSWKKKESINTIAKRAMIALSIQWHTIEPGGGFCLPPDKLGYLRRDFMRFCDDFLEKEEHNANSSIDFSGFGLKLTSGSNGK